MSTKVADIWWGHHATHGWVVFDRSFPILKGANLAIVRCSDWTVISVPKVKFWAFQDCWPAEKHIKGLPPESQAPSNEKMEQLKAEFRARREGILERLIAAKHQEFLSRFSKISKGVSRGGTSRHRATVCYSCKTALNSTFDYQCNACGWILCWTCAACGCGYN